MDSVFCFANSSSLDSDLSVGQRYLLNNWDQGDRFDYQPQFEKGLRASPAADIETWKKDEEEKRKEFFYFWIKRDQI